MKKKLTAKTQELNPSLPQSSTNFSKCFVIEPETKEIALKKGVIYLIFNMIGEDSYDTELITRVVHDTIYNTYYQSENISPIQSLEKAILEARDKSAQLPNQTLTLSTQASQFNITASVLWGNVLYTVKYGNIDTYLVREGEILELESISEGSFSTSSEVTKDDDVVLMCTPSFKETYPLDKFLKSSISENNLEPAQACLLMRLMVDTNFSEDEKVDFGVEGEIVKNRAKDASENVFDKLSKLKDSVKKASQKVKLPENPIKQQEGITFAKPSRIRTGEKKKIKGIYIIVPVAIALGISIFLMVRSRQKQNEQKFLDIKEKNEVTESSNSQQTNTQESEWEKDKANDATNKTERITPKVFYDIKIAEANVAPFKMVTTANKIFVADGTTGDLYSSAKDLIRFTKESLNIAGVRSFITSEDKVHVYDGTTYKIINSETLEVEKQYNLADATLAYPYAGFVYSINGSTLNKGTISGEALENADWGKFNEFNGAKDMVIAYRIYIAAADNNLYVFSSGEKVDFKIKGLDKNLGSISSIETNLEFENIYIADTTNKRIVVIDTDGNFVKQFKADKEDAWSDLKDISVTSDEKTMYVLSGTKVFEVTLK